MTAGLKLLEWLRDSHKDIEESIKEHETALACKRQRLEGRRDEVERMIEYIEHCIGD